MLDQSRLCRMWLALSQQLSYQARQRLFSRYGSAEEAFVHVSSFEPCLIGDKAKEELGQLKTVGLDRLLQRLEELSIALCFFGDADYPPLLSDIIDPPDVLFYQGSLNCLQDKAIAIVGSRRETRYGRKQAKTIAAGLANEGVTIVSGLARGIDTAAHEGALLGGGKTVAVLGSGLANLYPKENKALAQDIIAQGGAIISELPPTAEPLPFQFPIRNRIISGLSHGVLLVEAREKSGTLITVGHALDQGREVFALPGDVDSPGSQVPHRLLRDGARLVTSADDILEDCGWKTATDKVSGTQLKLPPRDLTSAEKTIYDALCLEEKGYEELLQLTQLPVSSFQATLTILELEGIIATYPGKRYRLT